jgi:DNA-binding response OmpR family regulator
MQGDREMCLNAGMDHYIPKPIRVVELVDALRKAPRIVSRRYSKHGLKSAGVADLKSALRISEINKILENHDL